MANAFLRKAPRLPAAKVKNPMTPTANPSDDVEDEYADNEAKKVAPVKVEAGIQKKPSDAGKKKSAKGIEHMKSKDKNVKRQFSDVEHEVARQFGRPVEVAFADGDEMSIDEILGGMPPAAPEGEAPAEPMPEEPAAPEAEPEAKPEAAAEAEVNSLVDKLQAIIDNKELELKAKDKKDVETAIDELKRLLASIQAAQDYIKEYEPKVAEAEAEAVEEAAPAE